MGEPTGPPIALPRRNGGRFQPSLRRDEQGGRGASVRFAFNFLFRCGCRQRFRLLGGRSFWQRLWRDAGCRWWGARIGGRHGDGIFNQAT